MLSSEEQARVQDIEGRRSRKAALEAENARLYSELTNREPLGARHSRIWQRKQRHYVENNEALDALQDCLEADVAFLLQLVRRLSAEGGG